MSLLFLSPMKHGYPDTQKYSGPAAASHVSPTQEDLAPVALCHFPKLPISTA
jgi:hypothetical protein